MIPESYGIERVDVSVLTAFSGNPRTHSDTQIDQIAASIREFGWTNPILVDAGCVIIAGHGRLAAASQLGLEQVPVIRLGHLSDAQRKALVIPPFLEGVWRRTHPEDCTSICRLSF